MSYWEILEIDATQDRQIVKRAYAQKLKKTRPDRDPQAFQILHRAYQQALNYCQWAQDFPEEVDEALEIESWEIKNSPPQEYSSPQAASAWIDPALIENLSPKTDLDSKPEGSPQKPHSDLNLQQEGLDLFSESYFKPFHQEILEEHWEESCQKIIDKSETILSDAQLFNRKESWRFLQANPNLFDFQAKEVVSTQLLGLFINHQKGIDKNPSQKINIEVLAFLNEIFWWTERIRDYENYYSPQELENLLTELKPSRPAWASSQPKAEVVTEVPGVYYGTRLLAFLLDIAITFVLSFVLVRLSNGTLGNEEDLFTCWACFTLMMFFFFELSPWRASPGKKIFRLKIIWPFIKKATLEREDAIVVPIVFWRMALLVLSATLFHAAIIANIFCVKYRHRLLHDWLSGVVIVKNQKK